MASSADKLEIKGKFRSNFLVIVILAMAGSAIFGLPFFRFEYYDAYVTTYHLTNTQMGVFSSVIGIFGIISYLFGGVVADGMSVRKIITVSLLVTGIAGLFHLLPLTFYGLLIVYAVWGISTTFAFQPACVKAVRILAGNDNQGKAYGFYEGTSSVMGAVISMVALGIFNWGISQAGNQVAAMKAGIMFYSVFNIIMGIVAFFLLRGTSVTLRAEKVTFTGIANIIKNPVVWIIALVGFCNHILCIAVYYYIPYTTGILGASVTIGALLGIFRKWGGFVGNIGGGYLADKIGTGKLMLRSYGIVLIAQIAMLLVPPVSSSIVLVAVLFVIIYTFFSINTAMSWTMMSESALPLEYSGTIAGLICTVGAIPETFVSLLAGHMIDSNEGALGFRLFFIFLAAVTVLGFLLLRLYNKRLEKIKRNAASQPKETADQCCGCRGGVHVVDECENSITCDLNSG
ncbi:MAG: MFS transporter [Atopobiaceae bacterium]|jgi:sugar phosphate permease